MKILVLGCNGQLGRCLKDQFSNSDHDVVYTSRAQIDIADFKDTKTSFLSISPDLVINASAYTSVEKAEYEQEKAELINHHAVRNIANICTEQNNWLIHISTDYVFDGYSKNPYKEDDKTNPKSVYGKSKLNGELAIQSSGCKHIIIRTSWVFSEYGNNFLKTILRLGTEKDKLEIIKDQIGCPTYAQDIAKCIMNIIPTLNSKKNNGLYHYCGDKPCSWYEFAKRIFYQAQDKKIKIPSSIISVSTSSYSATVNRPPFSALDCSKIKYEYGVFPSNWREGVKQTIDQIY